MVPVAVDRKYSKQTHFSEGAAAYRNCNPYMGPSVCEEDSFVQLRQLCSSICSHESHQQRHKYDAAPALPVLPRSIFSVPPCSPSHPMTAQMICHVIVYVRSVLKLLKLTLISPLSSPFYSSGCWTSPNWIQQFCTFVRRV